MVTPINDSVTSKQHEIHPGGAKRLSEVVDDYVLTMQHALRQDLEWQLKQRALDDAGVLPPLEPHEMFDYLRDTDPEFYNWCFPFCAIRLTSSNLGYLHSSILNQFRATLNPVREPLDIERAKVALSVKSSN